MVRWAAERGGNGDGGGPSKLQPKGLYVAKPLFIAIVPSVSVAAVVPLGMHQTRLTPATTVCSQTSKPTRYKPLSSHEHAIDTDGTPVCCPRDMCRTPRSARGGTSNFDRSKPSQGGDLGVASVSVSFFLLRCMKCVGSGCGMSTRRRTTFGWTSTKQSPGS